MRIGLIREMKNPPDRRVAMSPDQARYVRDTFGVDVLVQSSSGRCYPDEAYRRAGFEVRTDVSEADILFGIKEVPIDALIPGKRYFFFSHTIKKQAYNRPLLRAILDKHITLVDYEALTDRQGRRLVAFGEFAGMVGAHNGIWTYGERTGAFHLPRMYTFDRYEDARRYYAQLQLPPMRIVVTGTGRVATGAVRTLRDMGIRQVTPEQYLQEDFHDAVFTQLSCKHYVRPKGDVNFQKEDFYNHPDRFESAFLPYAAKTDIFINGIFYDKRAPAFFTLEEMASPDFAIQVIADVTCDIAPDASIPATIEASTIADPVFGFDPRTATQVAPYRADAVDMMTIDNLPSELPKDASEHFGQAIIRHIIPELLHQTDTDIIERATVTRDGKLTERFAYLQDYVG